MWRMRSANSRRCTSCVTITIVIPCFRLRSTRIRITMSVFFVSKSPVGSSRRRSSGQLTMARAMVTRCCSPPDSCDGTCPSRSPIPTLRSSSVDRCRLSDEERDPCSVRGTSTFSSAESCDIKLNV
mmetsp:Transcript_25224/g.59818  ORF Transcript_25224/g.59818 Transcript_25224/m.59818 type:complete len:126 (+) Transcript_25224:422-799(+)